MPALGAEQAGAPETQLRGRAAAKAREPAQVHREDQDQEDTDQERGQRDPQQGQGHEHLAHECAALECRVHPHWHTDDQRQHCSDHGQLKGGWKAFGNERRHLCALAETDAKFALCSIQQEVPELHEKRLVQPQGFAQLGDLIGSCVLSQQEGDWITHVLEQHERNERHGDHHDHRLYQSAQYECKHS
ncbi:hypothetical protein D3C72_1079660 [compost metagenome]